MASAQAQTYFNSFSPQEQQNIRRSWGGADLMDDWFQNAVTAGAVDPRTGQARDAGGENYAEEKGKNYSEGYEGPSGLQKGQTPTSAAQLRKYAKEAGWSEDFNRFNDATLQGWLKHWDPQTMKFKSMRGAQGGFEKPTECPPGTVPGGPNETDACKPAGGQGAPAPKQTVQPAPQEALPEVAQAPVIEQKDLWLPPQQKTAQINKIARTGALGPRRLWRDTFGKDALYGNAMKPPRPSETAMGTKQSSLPDNSSKMLL